MKNYSLILADDHTLFRSGMVNLLNEISIIDQIYEAANGLEVLSLLKSLNGEIDLVLLDLKMPKMNGLETCRKVKEKYPKIKIVILSMIDQEQVIIQMLKEDINAYILKNCTEEVLNITITEVLIKGYYFDPYIIKLLHKSLRGERGQDKSELYFTKRELEILEVLCQGKSSNEIAESLFISPRTVESHKQNLMEKTATRNSVELVIYAIKNGLVELSLLMDI